MWLCGGRIWAWLVRRDRSFVGAKSCGERVQNGWVVVFVVKVEESKTLVPVTKVKRDWDTR